MFPKRLFVVGTLAIVVGLVAVAPSVTRADENAKAEVDGLNDAVKEKRSRIQELDKLIGSYRARIADQESKQATLENEILLLDNRIKEKELGIQRAKTEIESLTLEIAALEETIKEEEAHIASQRELVAEFIRRVRQADEVSTLDVLLTQPSLSAFFDQIEDIKRLEKDLSASLEKLKGEKEALQKTRKLRDERRDAVVVQQQTLKDEQEQLENQRNSRISLISETQQSQEEFERILYELRQQQQMTQEDISRLEERLKDTLDAVDEALARGDILLNWPVPAARGISAHFHDRTYPFRHFFEHPGTDIPVPVGTPVRAAAGGYVAWNKTGRQYGNYTMIVHPGGIATVYAHLSKFVAKPDTYVERGEIIALSGGRPGDPGAGLSTGPHLHFEVRQDGVPVDAENFLPEL